MRGAAQIENTINKCKKTYINNISTWTMSGGKLTSNQVHRHSMSNVVRKRLVRVCFKKLLKASTLEKLLSGTDLQIKFHNFTILLNDEAWNAEVLQIEVFKLKELLSLVRPWVTKETKPCTFRSICPHKHTQLCSIVVLSSPLSFLLFWTFPTPFSWVGWSEFGH